MENAFERIAESLRSPMVIVTGNDGTESDGCLVGFCTQCSIDPVRYVVCLSKENQTYEIACNAVSLVVHMLRDDPRDRALGRLFGEHTAHEVDKLAQCEWRPGPDGAPVLSGCDWFSGRIIQRLDLGDHVGFVLGVGDGEALRAHEANLTFEQMRNLDAGNPA